MEASVEAQTGGHKKRARGGWITFPFIIGSVVGLSLAATTWYANIVVYAIKKYNINRIPAAQIQNVINGGISFFPVIGAILADSYFGSYTVVVVSLFLSFIGAIMFTISSAIPSLRPPPCMNITPTISNSCTPPSSLQYTFLYATLTVSMVGFGGTRFVLAAFGADQFTESEHQHSFFNWFIFAIESTSVIGFTVIVYLQEKGGWTLSFGLTAVVTVLAIALFWSGSRFYSLSRPPQGSPFASIARVLVASCRKFLSKKDVGEEVHNTYFYGTPESTICSQDPSSSLRFLNRAALIKGSDRQLTTQNLKKSWRLCTVEEVEDLKKFLKAMPIWSGGILLSTVSGAASSLAVLQSLSMDRSISPRFQIPAASILVFAVLCGAIMISVLDRVIYPLWKKLIGDSIKTLWRIGIGYFIVFLSMVFFAIIENRRLNNLKDIEAHDGDLGVSPMSVLWLILPLGLLGVSSSFYYPAEIGFYYQELPSSLTSTAASLASLHFAVGYYLSSVFISLIHRITSWLPDDINNGRMDKVYWTLAIIGGVNFVYYLVCAKLYRYRNDGNSTDKNNVPNN